MARSGITQTQVNEAADALLRGGERPTIERVRQALGTGSPNTLVRLLEEWWSDLGRRLDAQAAKMSLPDAPEPVVAAASQLWLAAVEHAQGLAKSAIADEVAALASERAAMAERERQRDAELVATIAATQTALEAQASAETRLADIERLSHSLALQRDDLQTQRDAATTERDVLSRRLAEARESHEQAQREAAAERQALEAQFRAGEDRWLREVDRARQDAGQAIARLEKVDKQLAAAVADSREKELAHEKALAERERALVKTLATTEAQGTEIERLYAQLNTAMKGVTSAKKRRPSRASGATKSTSKTTPKKRVKSSAQA